MSTPTAEELLREQYGDGYRVGAAEANLAQRLATALAEVTEAVKLNLQLRQRAEAAEAKWERHHHQDGGDCLICAMETKYQQLYDEKVELVGKLAEAQQREILWRELYELEDRAYDSERYFEVVHLLGLDAAREEGEKP